MTTRWKRVMRLGAVMALGLGCGVALASPPPEADRAAILALSGSFKVNFHFHETLTFDKDREPSEDENSDAHEQVLVVEDSPGFISLQHLLVVEADGEVGVVKHWREDWQYEPRYLTTYRGEGGKWERVKLKRHEARGAWAQTVYSVDDSPRYGGVGVWRHEGGLSFWESKETWRPLPRRESAQRKYYDVLVGLNRLTITPTGWVHEQDNYKLDQRPDGNRIIARETGLNPYVRVMDYDFTPASDYWKATQDFWKGVRETWRCLLRDQPAVALPSDGRALGRKVLAIAEDLRDGRIASVAEADKVFHEALDTALKGKDESEKAADN